MITSGETPTPVKDFLAAISERNSSKLASTFSTSASMIDEAKSYNSRNEIQAWAEEALVAHKATISVQDTQVDELSCTVRLTMDGDFVADYGITEPFTLYLHFSLTADRTEIQHLRIDDIAPDESTMKAAWASRGDPNDPLAGYRLGLRRQPKVPEGWVRVKVSAAGLNYHDIFTLMGVGFHKLTFPLILGNEATGTLDDGSEVIIYPLMSDPSFNGTDITLDPKRHVLGELTQGGLAEYVVVPKENVVPKPREISNEGAAGLAISWLTAYRMIFTKAKLRRGDKMLIQGSAGGVAIALMKLGAAAGITAWATGRSAEKREIARRHGAQMTFEPGAELPELVDAVFDLSGAQTLSHSIASVRAGGTIVISGIHSGANVELDMFRWFTDQITITGSYLGTREEFESLIRFVVDNKIDVQPSRVIPVEKVEEGLRDIHGGRANGKIVLTWS
jgi:NADPH:quinone reductase-like Zn-dependent oxidoreductase